MGNHFDGFVADAFAYNEWTKLQGMEIRCHFCDACTLAKEGRHGEERLLKQKTKVEYR